MTDAMPQRCHDCLARDHALCAALHDSELAAIGQIGRRKTVPKGGIVSWAGDDNPLCANVVSGALKLQAATEDGREQTVGLLFSGDFFGQPFEETSMITAEALTDTDLCLYPRSAFERVLGEQPKLERALLQRTLKSLKDAQERQLVLGRKSAKAKLAWFLLSLPRDTANRIELPISRREIADYLGLTIETVSRQFTDLRKSGAIIGDRGDRQVQIADLEALQFASE